MHTFTASDAQSKHHQNARVQICHFMVEFHNKIINIVNTNTICKKTKRTFFLPLLFAPKKFSTPKLVVGEIEWPVPKRASRSKVVLRIIYWLFHFIGVLSLPNVFVYSPCFGSSLVMLFSKKTEKNKNKKKYGSLSLASGDNSTILCTLCFCLKFLESKLSRSCEKCGQSFYVRNIKNNFKSWNVHFKGFVPIS